MDIFVIQGIVVGFVMAKVDEEMLESLEDLYIPTTCMEELLDEIEREEGLDDVVFEIVTEKENVYEMRETDVENKGIDDITRKKRVAATHAMKTT